MPKRTKGVVTAGHIKTAEAAVCILEEGGNAFDAAIAAFFAAAVAEPCMGSLGGGGFANIIDAQGQSQLLDFFVQTPLHKKSPKHLEFYPITVNFGSTTEDFHVGMGSIGVPGMVAGIYSLYEQYGTLPMRVLVEPAIELAKGGVMMTDFQFFDIRVLEPIMTKVDASRAIFYPDGKPLPVGQWQYMPAMGDYMDYLTREGRAEFYEGEAAKRLVKACQENGGLLEMEDLRSYQTIIRQPLKFNYQNKTILTNPLPSTGGTVIGLAFRALSQLQKTYQAGGTEHLQAMQKVVGEMYTIDRSLENLTKKWGSTSHFNIIDEHGNAISSTFSNGEGCGFMIPDTAIMMNNMLGEAALLPNGFHSWETNQRLSSMMAPTLVTDARGQVEIATGTGGASRIPAAIVQVLHSLIDLGLNVDDAVHHPRIHHQDGVLNIEAGWQGNYWQEDELLKEVVQWEEPSMFFGGVHTIARLANGELQGAGDGRREGYLLELK